MENSNKTPRYGFYLGYNLTITNFNVKLYDSNFIPEVGDTILASIIIEVNNGLRLCNITIKRDRESNEQYIEFPGRLQKGRNGEPDKRWDAIFFAEDADENLKDYIYDRFDETIETDAHLLG